MCKRGLPEGSYFEVYFSDGSYRKEDETNWSDISELKKVKYFDNEKYVRVCIFPVNRIKIIHGELEVDIPVPEGCSVYQSVRSNAYFALGQPVSYEVFGRTVGIVRGGSVIEERFLNGRTKKVEGIK